ncbi:MAG: LAGLIDADG family homing endonuclease [Clostridia bacterium]
MKNFTKTQRAYLAGFFDGEGTFSIIRRPDKRSPAGYGYQPYIEVTSTNEEIIKWLTGFIGKGFTFYRPKKGNANNAFTQHITSMETIVEFISILYPYLRLKKAVANKVRQFCKSRQKTSILSREKRGFTDKELKIFDEIRALNKRGRNA